MRGLLLLALFAECNASLIIRDDINSNADGSNQFNTALNSDIGTTDLSAETAQLLNPGTDVTASSDNLLALGSLTGDNPSILDPTTPETSASTPPDSYLVAGSASDKNVWQLGWDGIAAVYSVLASCAHSLLSYSLTMGQSGSLARESSTDYNTKKQDLCPVPTYAHRGKALCDKGVMHVQYIRTLKTFILHGFTTYAGSCPESESLPYINYWCCDSLYILQSKKMDSSLWRAIDCWPAPSDFYLTTLGPA